MFHNVPCLLSCRNCTTACGQRPVLGIVEPDRLHRPEAQRIKPAFGHHLDRHTAFEIGGVLLPLAKLGLGRVEQALMESQILLLVHRAVDIVLAVALVPATGIPGDVQVDAVMIDDRGDRIEKGEAVLPGGSEHALGERLRRQRPGCDNRQAIGRQRIDPFADDFQTVAG
jgi:hypothetical protein